MTNEEIAKGLSELLNSTQAGELTMNQFRVVQEARDALVAATPTDVGAEWPKETDANEQTDASGTPQVETTASASDTDGPIPVATDTPVHRMPTSSKGRALVRMGHRDGKGRP